MLLNYLPRSQHEVQSCCLESRCAAGKMHCQEHRRLVVVMKATCAKPMIHPGGVEFSWHWLSLAEFTEPTVDAEGFTQRQAH